MSTTAADATRDDVVAQPVSSPHADGDESRERRQQTTDENEIQMAASPSPTGGDSVDRTRISSPLLPNDMRRSVRSPRHVRVDRPQTSSVYAELTIDTDFWADVFGRYATVLLEQQHKPPSAMLLRAHVASHAALQETPEAEIFARYADASGYVPAVAMTRMLAALGADCTDRVAEHVLIQCAGSGSSGLSEPQFMALAEALRATACQNVIANRLRSRTPERDAAMRRSIISNATSGGGSFAGGSPPNQVTSPLRASSLSQSGVVAVPAADDAAAAAGALRASSRSSSAAHRGRSPSSVGRGPVHGGRTSSAAYRRPSPARTTASNASTRSGAHTLKSLASLQQSLRRRAAEEVQLSESLRSRSPKLAHSASTPRRRDGIPPAATGVSPVQPERRRRIPSPTLDTVNVRDLKARRTLAAGTRNAIGSKQPVLTTNRFDVATLRYS